jgi:HK97 family phage major capsid protein
MTIAQRVAQVSANYENATRCREFTAYAKYLLDAKGMPATAWKNAEQNRASPRVVDILKSAVGAGTTSDPVWAGALADYNLIAQSFLGSLREFSSFDTVLNDGSFKRVPLRSRVKIVTASAVGSLVGEGQPKPISKLSLADQQLVVRKVTSIVAITNELVRSVEPAAIDLVGNELKRAVAVASDATFLDIVTSTTGISSAPSTGMSAAQFSADLASALDSLSYGADARLYLVLSPASAKVVAFMRDANGNLYPGMTVSGGTIAGIKVVVSNAATDAILFDASQIAANSDTIVLDASDQASVVLDDAPSSGPQGMTNLWQSNMRGLKASRFFGAEVLRPEAVAVITGTTS